MTTFTEHYGLRQPEETDEYDIGEMNENMGTAADTGTTTINF